MGHIIPDAAPQVGLLIGWTTILFKVFMTMWTEAAWKTPNQESLFFPVKFIATQWPIIPVATFPEQC